MGKELSNPETNQKIWINKNNTFINITYEQLKNKNY